MKTDRRYRIAAIYFFLAAFFFARLAVNLRNQEIWLFGFIAIMASASGAGGIYFLINRGKKKDEETKKYMARILKPNKFWCWLLGEGPQIWQRMFLISAGSILLATGLAKFISAFGKDQVLQVQDPLFGMPFYELMLVAAVLEFFAGFACIIGRRANLSLALVAWLSTSFALYRAGLWYLGWHQPCPCLGTFASVLPLSAPALEKVLLAILVYLAFGSYTLLCFSWILHHGKGK